MKTPRSICAPIVLVCLTACSQSYSPPSSQNSISCRVGHGGNITYKLGGPSVEVEKAVDWIVSITGGEQNFTLHSASFSNGTPIAFACLADQKRYIVYDRDYFYARSNRLLFSDISILSHEILHHTAAHVSDIGESSWDNELAADRFSGFIVASLGGSLDEAQSFAALLSEEGSKTHPSRSERLEAVKKGWIMKRNHSAE